MLMIREAIPYQQCSDDDADDEGGDGDGLAQFEIAILVECSTCCEFVQKKIQLMIGVHQTIHFSHYNFGPVTGETVS